MVQILSLPSDQPHSHSVRHRKSSLTLLQDVIHHFEMATFLAPQDRRANFDRSFFNWMLEKQGQARSRTLYVYDNEKSERRRLGIFQREIRGSPISVKHIIPNGNRNCLEQDQPTDKSPAELGLLIAHPPSHFPIVEDEGPYHLPRHIPAEIPLTLKRVNRLCSIAAP